MIHFFKKFYLAQADGSLSKVLEISNSTREKQPKVIGLLFWMFLSIRVLSSYQSALQSVLSPISTDFTILCSILRNILNTHSSKSIFALREMLIQTLIVVRYKIYHRKSKVEVCCIDFSNLFVTLNTTTSPNFCKCLSIDKLTNEQIQKKKRLTSKYFIRDIISEVNVFLTPLICFINFTSI